jgi:hypothetical protein
LARGPSSAAAAADQAAAISPDTGVERQQMVALTLVARLTHATGGDPESVLALFRRGLELNQRSAAAEPSFPARARRCCDQPQPDRGIAHRAASATTRRCASWWPAAPRPQRSIAIDPSNISPLRHAGDHR